MAVLVGVCWALADPARAQVCVVIAESAGHASCRDGVDNDCDGLADLLDADCREPERCDGIDNDADGAIDEDFPLLGTECSVGLGACRASGLAVCSADESGTTCDAVPARPSAEGPAGFACRDGLDNDCDGLDDAADPGCAASDLAVSCALPFRASDAHRGRSCGAWHRIEFATSRPSAEISAELLALDPQGNVLGSLPVAPGDLAHLRSRVDPADFRLKSTAGARATRHQVFAPVPMLRVTASDGGHEVQAFCSNIPFLHVVQPSSSVVTLEGEPILVRVALPLVDAGTLDLRVDGVEVLSALGVDPAACRPDAPCGGPLPIGGATVTVSELAIDSGALATPSANSLTLELRGLAPGGHIVVASGRPRADAPTEPLSASCHVDDLRDRGDASVFAIQILSPEAGAIADDVPTPVAGQVAHGRPIGRVGVNGVEVAGAQSCSAGDGETTGDLCVLDFAAALPPGTFDPGSNRLVASASDDLGNRTFDERFFGLGRPEQLASPGRPGGPPGALVTPASVFRPEATAAQVLLEEGISFADVQLDAAAVRELGYASLRLEGPELLAMSVLFGARTTSAVDPAVDATPGALLTPADPPQVQPAPPDDAFFAVSDDVFNLLFAGMTQAGRLEAGCTPADRTLGDLLPADCESLSTPLGQGVCHGVRGDDCQTLPVSPAPGAADAERRACEEVPERAFHPLTPLLFCARQDVPPRLLVRDDPLGSQTAVEAELRLNDLLFSIVVDRQGDGLGGSLDATPDCFAPSAGNAGDCRLAALCLDLNFLASVALLPARCAPGETGFALEMGSIGPGGISGAVCGGALAPDDPVLLALVQVDPKLDRVAEAAEAATPPICTDGLSLGGGVSFSEPRLIAIQTDPAPSGDLADYVGISGSLARE